MNLIKAGATVGGLTMVSRVLGFARDVLIAMALGTGPVADAFFVAFRFPNLFRRLFAEGAFNSAFVPLFSKRLEGEGVPSARQFAVAVLSVLVTTLAIFTAIAEISMPWLMMIIAPGFLEDPHKYDLAVLLTQIAFPYLLFMSLTAMISGVLNSMGRFAAAAAAPILLNVILIAALLGIVRLGLSNTNEAGVILVWGVALAGLAQAAALWFASRRAGITLGFTRPRLTPGVMKLVRLGIPGIIAGGITQINLLIGTIIASLQASAVAWLYYADRIYQLPLGVIGVAIGVVLLPDLSRRLRAGDGSGLHSSQNRALELSMLLTIPAAAALVAMPAPIIQTLFERGAFAAADTEAAALALAAFAPGLPAFVLIKVFSPGFFAREDTRTPMYFAGISVAVNITGSLGLFFILGHVGIAVATSLAGWINAGLLGWTLYRRGGFQPDARLKRRLPRILAASVLMALVLWWMGGELEGAFQAGVPLAMRATLLAGMIFGGMMTFWALAEFSGAAHIGEVIARFRRRPPPR
ncbi:MAG: murein biosynthesis integral membrane protein MurJ [Hyphomicrobiales bacterium]|nr:MAG: murein biosynthesis integral membrane protein MurJ [Hyphomicrobiales bacterium]